MTGLEKYFIGVIVVDTIITGILVFKNRQLKKLAELEKLKKDELFKAYQEYIGVKEFKKRIIHNEQV